MVGKEGCVSTTHSCSCYLTPQKTGAATGYPIPDNDDSYEVWAPMVQDQEPSRDTKVVKGELDHVPGHNPTNENIFRVPDSLTVSYQTPIKGSRVHTLKYSSNRDINYFHVGRVFQISTQDRNIEYRCRTMVVLAVTDHHAILCLALCLYQDISGREDPRFFESHVATYAMDSGPPRKCAPTQRPSIRIQLNPGLDLLKSVWINCQQPCIIQAPKMAIADVGYLEPTQLAILKREYCTVQESLLDKNDKAVSFNQGGWLAPPGSLWTLFNKWYMALRIYVGY